MKLTTISKIASVLASFAVVTIFALSGTASAIGEGQIEGGDIYRIKNLTKNTAFADTTFADQCESLQYKVRLHNPGPGIVNSVNVKVDFPGAVGTTHVSTVTITGQNAQPATTADTATLKLSTAQKVDYVSGSTELLNTDNVFVANLSDGITGSGVNIGNVGVSLEEIKFVQFKAKINCPTPPPTTPPTVTTTTPPPTKLVNTGPGEVAGIFAATTVAGTVTYRWMLGRRLNRQ